MKIAILGPIDSPIKKDGIGGTEIWAYYLAEGLSQKGHEVTVFGSEGTQFSGACVTVVSPEKIRDQDGQISKKLFAAYSIKEVADFVQRQDEFDLVQIGTFSIQYIFPLLKLIHIPVAVTFHGTGFSFGDMEKIYADFDSAAFIYPSRQYLNIWPKPQRYFVVPNGINLEDFSPTDDKDNYFFWLGRLTPEKGILSAIEFAERSGKELVIAGPVSNQEYFKEVVEPRLKDHIRYVGEVDLEQKRDYYAKAKATLITSQAEAFGLTAIESMASGTPVIAFRLNSLEEIIEQGKTGFIIDQSDIEGLIEASNKVASLDSAECRREVEQKFSLEQMVSAYLECYKSLTGKE